MSSQEPPTFYPTASSAEIIKSFKKLNNDGDPYFDERSLHLDDRKDSITLRFNDFNETPTISHINKKNGSIAIFDDASNIEEDEQLVLRYASKNITSSDFSKADRITENLADLLDDADEVKSWEKDDKAVASSYLSFEHYRINEALRNKTASNDLNQTISRLEVKDTLEEETVVYRGLRKLPENMLKDLNEGSYSDSGLLSTSTNPKVALGFSGNRKDSVILKIVLPKGTKCWNMSKDDSEAEIILPRNFDLSSAEVLQLGESVEIAR